MAELNYEPICYVHDNLFKQMGHIKGMQNFVMSKRDISDYMKWLTSNDLYDVFKEPDTIKEEDIEILKIFYGD